LADTGGTEYLLWHTVLLLLGLLMTVTGLPVLALVGPAVAAVGVVGYVTYGLTRQDSAAVRLRTSMSDAGLLDLYEHRVTREYADRIKNANDHIDVLGFGLGHLLADYCDEFELWSSRAHVRIILIDPQFPAEAPYAAQRDLEERPTPGTIEMDVQNFLAATADLRAKTDRFQVHLMQCLPSITVFRVDDELFWGPYLVGGQSRNLPSLRVGRQGYLFRRLSKHFEDVWANWSHPVP
jgi:hypothetical protein